MEKKRSAYVEEEIESDENPIAKEKDYAKGKENRDTNLEVTLILRYQKINKLTDDFRHCVHSINIIRG